VTERDLTRPTGQCHACGSDDVRLYEVDRAHSRQLTVGQRMCSGCIGIAVDSADIVHEALRHDGRLESCAECSENTV
jgi:hypothetical protein